MGLTTLHAVCLGSSVSRFRLPEPATRLNSLAHSHLTASGLARVDGTCADRTRRGEPGPPGRDAAARADCPPADRSNADAYRIDPRLLQAGYFLKKSRG